MDPEKTFVTAQRIFGGVHPSLVFFFLAATLSPLLFSSHVVAGCQIAQGGVCLNWILKKLLSRLSVFSGVCTPSLFFLVSRRRPLRLPFCLAGARRQHAQRRGGQGPQHHLASVISCAALPVHHFLARPAKPACVARRYRLRFLALDHALDPGGVGHPAQRRALQAEVVQVKGAKLLA